MWLALSIATASVTVFDSTRCVTADLLENELIERLGEGTVVDVRAYVHADADRRVLRYEVRVPSRVRPAIVRDLEARVEDCRILESAVALAIQQGLAALPGWSTESVRQPRVSGMLSVGVDQGKTTRMGVGAGADLRVGRTGLVHLSLDSRLAPQIPVGDGQATQWVVGLRPAVGVATARHRFVVAARFGYGWAFGRGFDQNASVRLPHIALVVAGQTRVVDGLLVGVDLETPMIRSTLVADDGRFTEGWLKAGVRLTIRPSSKNRGAQ